MKNKTECFLTEKKKNKDGRNEEDLRLVEEKSEGRNEGEEENLRLTCKS